MKLSFKNKKYNTIFFYAITLVLFFVLCWNFIIVRPGSILALWESILQIVKPIFYAFIVAYIMTPLMNLLHLKVFRFVQKKREFSVIRKLIALFFTFLVFFSVITVFVWVVAPRVVENINNLKDVLTGYYTSIDGYINTMREKSGMFAKIYGTLLQNEGNLSDLLMKAVKALANVSDYIIPFISNFVNEVKTIFIGIFLSVYFVYYKEMLVRQVSRFGNAFLSPKAYSYTAHIIDDIDVKFAKFLRGKTFDSTLVGIVLYIIYRIVGMPFAEILAIVGGVMNMIPVFGPIISSFVCGFIVLLTAPEKLIPYIIIVCVVGVIDSQIIEPKLLGDSLGLKPVWITLAIIVMSALFGFFGMFFGVPIFAVIYTLIQEAIVSRSKKRAADTASDDGGGAPPSEENIAEDSPTADNSEQNGENEDAPQKEAEE